MSAKEMFEELGFGVRKNKHAIIVENDLEKYTFSLERELMYIDNKMEYTHRVYLTTYLVKAIQQQMKELGWERDK